MILTTEFIQHIKDKFKKDHNAELSDAQLKDAAMGVLGRRYEKWFDDYMKSFSPEMLDELAFGDWSATDVSETES